MESTDLISNPEKQRSRWPGVLFSIWVPGFGLMRAGHFKRGFSWLAAIHIYSVVAVWLFATDAVPLALGVAALVTILPMTVWMWVDSFRPGRMSLARWALFVGLFLFVGWSLSLVTLVGKSFKIPTGSMEPALKGGMGGGTSDHVVVDRLAYQIAKPRRGDLIVFATSQIPSIYSRGTRPSGAEVYYTMRLVGLPGERLKIEDGKVYADGRELGAQDGIPPVYYTIPKSYPYDSKPVASDFVVGQNEYFVLGDNSERAADSRYWGNVPAEALFGKVTGIYYPFSRFGRIKNPADSAPSNPN